METDWARSAQRSGGQLDAQHELGSARGCPAYTFLQIPDPSKLHPSKDTKLQTRFSTRQRNHKTASAIPRTCAKLQRNRRALPQIFKPTRLLPRKAANETRVPMPVAPAPRLRRGTLLGRTPARGGPGCKNAPQTCRAPNFLQPWSAGREKWAGRMQGPLTSRPLRLRLRPSGAACHRPAATAHGSGASFGRCPAQAAYAGAGRGWCDRTGRPGSGSPACG